MITGIARGEEPPLSTITAEMERVPNPSHYQKEPLVPLSGNVASTSKTSLPP